MIEYRDATLADAEALNAMAKQCAIDTFASEYEPDDFAVYLAQAYGPEGLVAHLADPAIRFRIALEDGRIIGYSKLSRVALPAPDPQPGAAELRQLYVLKDWHGAGVATALMDWTLDTARTMGAPEIYLAVFAYNHRARAFYTRYGFVEIGSFDFYVGTRIDCDRIWWRTL
ncbi:GNAT family N-acetyltransferase [Sphingomonas sp. JC676]|uniref:GNAT family N-acetyltransferase n=1 Tax=Sphingomonas sp. JC676 TaxID=2768065 RepID=UPI0016585607|nr:GNAT family N-acetyltransferase [Sphingomonas sp. JC676]MBC9034758.1 GNAT family N-acetyltransferase [Sphingomonas sp. JC676]